jgi:hypothetical protein
VGLIIGRFSIGWALKHRSEQFWIKTGGLLGGLGFVASLIISTTIVDINKSLASIVAFTGFFLAGFGSSAMAPLFFSIVGRLSDGKNALAVAQLTSITVALICTGLMMSLLIYFGKVGSDQKIKSM